MRCRDIQKQLAFEADAARLSAGARAHLRKCADCRRAQAWYAGMERELREMPGWRPPRDFVERVASQGRAVLREIPCRPRTASQPFGRLPAAVPFAPIALGLLTAASCLIVLATGLGLEQGCRECISALSNAVLRNTVPLAWASGALSIGFSAWITGRAMHSR